MGLKDPDENLGAQMIRQAAERTGDAVGDGTSTSTVLAHAIFADGVRNVAAGASAIDLKRGLDRGVRVAVEAIRGLSRPVKSRTREGPGRHDLGPQRPRDRRAGRRRDGEGRRRGRDHRRGGRRRTETHLEVVEGMQFDRGYVSPYFVTDAEKMEAVLEDAAILLTDRRSAS